MTRELVVAGLVGLPAFVGWLVFAVWFVRRDRHLVMCPDCLAFFPVVEWLESESTPIGGDVLVCTMCARARDNRSRPDANLGEIIRADPRPYPPPAHPTRGRPRRAV